MMSLQSMKGGPSITGEGRAQKPKTLPCKYCSKRFRRVEHVQRHERTHTKEKPFECLWAKCGKTFGRRDLLVRHEKLVHLAGPHETMSRRQSSAAVMQQVCPESNVEAKVMMMPGVHSQQYRPRSMNLAGGQSLTAGENVRPRSPVCSLDLLSDAANQLATAGTLDNMQSMMADMGRPPGSMSRAKSYDGMSYERCREQEADAMSVAFHGQAGPPGFFDYNYSMDDLTPNSTFLPQAFETDLSLWHRSPSDLRRGPSKSSSQFPSRFPSIQPEVRDVSEGMHRSAEELMRLPCMRVSKSDQAVIKTRLQEFSSVLPADFDFPSRHTVTRFLDGYLKGFSDQLPILHLPTTVPAELSPELLLAILAVGAQCRLETQRGNALWYAAKTVALEQVRRRRSQDRYDLLPTPVTYSPHSTGPSPSDGVRDPFSSIKQEQSTTQDTHREPYSPNTPQARMETIQALLHLFAVGLWGPKAILFEALSLQSLLALLVREDGLQAEPTQAADWESWVRIEAGNRTKVMTYCYFNLCSLAYNMPPLLLTSELSLILPHSAKLWQAESTWQWQQGRQSLPGMDISIQDAFARLFSRSSQLEMPYLTSLGYYVLIHALLQHIFLVKQTSFIQSPSFETSRALRPDDVEEVSQALRLWHMEFEQQQGRVVDGNHKGLGDSFPGGPVAYNSAALGRLVSIRLYTDLSPSRRLESRDASHIASAFYEAPYLSRSAQLNRAVLQAIHALSVLVKVGVKYVARRKWTEWSMEHSFCNLECAMLISKWLMTLASLGPGDAPTSEDERHLLRTLRQMLDQTEFAVPIDPSLRGGGGAEARGGCDGSAADASFVDVGVMDGTKMRRLAVAVIRLWAETFKGSHLFEMVREIGEGLEGYADLSEKSRHGGASSMSNLAPESGL